MCSVARSCMQRLGLRLWLSATRQQMTYFRLSRGPGLWSGWVHREWGYRGLRYIKWLISCFQSAFDLSSTSSSIASFCRISYSPQLQPSNDTLIQKPLLQIDHFKMAGEKIRYIVECKTEDDVAPAKKFAEEQGGVIESTYTIIPGFVVDMPADTVSTFANSPHILSAQLDGKVTTQ
ncbi:hypothetical protein BKA65DRAFT_519485 [Rhexocercosporidium sp. MPI-PUGE-AT-0058]|nr:hypothetical protein BKA65DRAFT_519485 [Rhexocercosporidium sp. MPI-PUGE-AT-0058]